ncbi:LAGLIDADG family homing endonuclease [Streptomyces mirabilis]|uniref:LAGLIDADG family homing endonuclease n=1 Tax=Streptomyces mirabilis TaxID=68239 RepID=UPI0033202A5C
MPAISVGSVLVDVLPDATGIRARMQAAIVPAADEVGSEVGRIIGRHISTQVAAAIRDGVTTGGRTAQAPAARQGQSTGSTFARSLKATLEAALRNLPEIRLHANSTDAEREIYQIRAQIQSLRDARIGIDVSSADAVAAIDHIRERLARLSASDADVAVRVDAGAASAQLAALQAVVNRLDGQTIRIDIDAQHAVGGVSVLTTAAAAFGPAILPAIPIVAAGLGAVAAAATAAGVGIGSVALVAVPAFKQIGTVLQAQKAAQDAATNATYKGAQASSQGASKALQMAGAQQALATAERNGAQQIAAAQQQVKQAKQGVADAIVQAGQRTKQAEQQVEQAEASLAQAQKDARQAQLDLTSARKEAERQLQDMNNQLVDSQLAQRDAALQVQEAQQNLNAVNAAGSKATALQRAQAQLQYDEAVQHLKEQQTATKRQAADTAAANKAGVKGSTTYKSAQDKLTQAQQNVAAQTKALKDAQANQAQTAVQNARSIATAQQKVADAERNVATAQQNAADSIASAQRQIQSASVSAAGGVDQAAIAQAKYQAALAKLTPSARDTFKAFLDLRSAFGDWSKALQPKVMPIFTRAIVGLKNALPGLTPFVVAAADAITTLQDKASKGFKSPWWKTFKKDLEGSIKPAIIGLGVSFGRIFKGIVGIIDAFLPHMGHISDTMQRITKRFADWGANLKGSPAFENFLSYASKQAPILGKTLGDLGGALFKLAVALQPMAGTATSFISAITGVIDALPIDVLTVMGVAFASIAIGSKLAAIALGVWKVAAAVAGVVTNILTGEQWALNTAMEANPIGIIVTAIFALIVALIYAYQHVGWFRAGVQAAWDGIKTGALFLWNGVLKPAFNGISQALQTVGRWATWLWTTAISPAFNFIVTAAKYLLIVLAVIVFTPILLLFRLVGAVATGLWENAIGPAFSKIATAATWLWATAIKPSFDFIVAGVRAVGDGASWLYNRAIKPAFDFIRSAISTAWTSGIKPAFTAITNTIGNILGPTFRWLRDKVVKPVWSTITSVVATAWSNGIKPAFDAVKTAVARVGDAFETARKAIKIAWDKLKDVARKPVQYVVDVVYNNGIRGVWNAVAGAFGAKKLDKFTFASGGIMPGYTPGRDVHKFVSPTGGALELSGGEAIMRPEFTRAVGSGFVGAMNSIAKSRGSQGVKAALAPVFGGNPSMPTDRSLKYANGGLVQRFGDGGIFGWIGSAASAIKGVGSAAWNGIKKGASWLADTLESSARAGVKHVVDPLLAGFPGMDTGIGKLIRKIPDKIIDTLFGYSKKADDKGGSGLGGPRIQAALNWAKSQAGKPYQWAGNGNPSWDCLTLSSMITTPQGHMELRDLLPGMEVMAYQGGKLVTSKVLAKWNTGEQELFKVRTRNRSIRATAGHRVLVAAPVKRPMMDVDERVAGAEWGTEWKEVRDLTPTDYLVTYTGSPKEGGEEVPEDLAWLMGLWLADGSVNQNSGIRICVYDDLAEKAMAVLRKYSPDRKVTHHPRHGVMISDIQRVRWMIRNGFHGKSHERTIPPVVMEWSHGAQDAFLKGYADGDGSYKDGKNGATFETAELIEYKATSRELIEGVREMHLRRGDRVSVTNTRVRTKDVYIGGKKIKNARPVHGIEVAPGRGVNQTTGAGHRPGLLRLMAQLRAENMSVQRVLSVEPDGSEETWDIEVEDSHSFVSDGLISHNCSGFMSAIESVIRGQKPHRRWATGAFSGKTAPPGWVLHGNSPFRIGITNAGVGHTAGTLGKTNVESRGGAGVVVGSRARSYKDSLFGSWYGFQPGKYDSGGYLQPGMNLAFNGTGRPEPVFTSAQANALTNLAAARAGGSGPASFQGDLYLDSGEFLGKVRGEATQVMQQGQQQLISVLNAT